MLLSPSFQGPERVRVPWVARLLKGKDAASQQGCTEDGEIWEGPGTDFVVSAQQRIVNELKRLPKQTQQTPQMAELPWEEVPGSGRLELGKRPRKEESP